VILAVVTVLAIVSVVTLSYRYAIHVPRYWLLVAIMAEAMAILAQINAWSPAPAVEWQAVAYLTAALYLATAMREISLVSDTRLTDLAPGVVAASLVVAAGLAVVVSPAPPGIAWSTDAARVYARIGEEPGDYVVLSVPLGITLDPRGETYGSGTDLQLYAASHRKRSTNGLLA
jgi:hypothetical protein